MICILKKDIKKCLKHDLALPAQKIDTPERFGVLKIEKANFWLPVNTVQDLKRADKYLKKLYK
ncbi:MAG: hypothetical protein A3A94_02755 [Candidatus Portnoybacteria bacterium RIFCSPLOWO2_01_FULL_43_11]|uniref:Uncharacterized protein n=2 Tax=Candidatus Portnoyibacteriota TaxID=1817913 RepID=A0A1G2FQ94_9BACT|nr:MAG: hypothetical protein A3A94_02755 [Candidatus Portnoybacteria bacterium RIFCSPLOWO2_01_FULL_43_11]OGZ39800.1 MAG: hypothetical protein A3I20_00885 [Candidatus Portnoybacteria bacterium RIFCSPLOWO2_02_FULL_40_15]